MAKKNGQADSLDLGHELPPADQAEDESEGSRAEQADVAALEAGLRKLKDERDAAIDRLARVQAEFDNARRRAQREQHEYREYALAETIKLLLPILDSFDRALTAQAGAQDFRSGMELIDRQLHDVLGKLGVSEIPAKGEPFDPTVHEAVEMVDTYAAPDHQVLQELQRGYRLKGRLLRPALVRVARNPGP